MLCFTNDSQVIDIFSLKELSSTCKILTPPLISNNIDFCENVLLVLSLNIWNLANNEYMYFERFSVKRNFSFISLSVIKTVY